MTRVGLTQRVSVIEEYGERRDCLDQQWTELLLEFGYTPILLPNRIKQVEKYLDSLQLDALVLTSGNDLASLDEPSNPAPERDRFERAVLEYAIENQIPLLGVCRGLEFLNVYFGGELTEVDNHVASTHSIEFGEDAQNLTLTKKATVNSYHDYGINLNDMGEDLTILGTAPDETVECVVHEDLPLWGIMWHPERESPSESVDRQIINHVLGEPEQ